MVVRTTFPSRPLGAARARPWIQAPQREAPGRVVSIIYDTVADLPPLLSLEPQPSTVIPFPPDWLQPKPEPPSLSLGEVSHIDDEPMDFSPSRRGIPTLPKPERIPIFNGRVPPLLRRPAQPESSANPVPAAGEPPALASASFTDRDQKDHDRSESGVEAVADAVVDDITRAIDSDELDSTPRAPTAQEVNAANVICAFYRRRSARKAGRGKSKTCREMKIGIYTTFLKESQNMEWPNVFYRLLFLGPVPHLFVVVESMKNSLHEAKDAAKQKLNLVQHLDLETVSSALTDLTYIF